MLGIIERLEECWNNGKSAVLATIIDTQGSTYRGIGAQSLILEDGSIIGTLSGGCVEGDIYEHALDVMKKGIPRTLNYDFRGHGDLLWGLGVGCDGSLTILLTPFNPTEHSLQAEKMLNAFRLRLTSPDSFSIVTVIQSDNDNKLSPGTEWILSNKNNEDPEVLKRMQGIFEIASKYRSTDRAGLVYGEVLLHDGETIRVQCFIQSVKRIPRLIIFGAGPDAIPLVQGANLMQWHVTLVDHRPGFATKERFPGADQVIIPPLGEFPRDLELNEDAQIVIMTHHFEQDQLFLKEILPRRVSYLGILGPRSRTEKLLQGIKEEGERIETGLMKNLYSPIGLDIGAETPEEIAFSILSEMVCTRTKRSGMPLRQRKGHIHARRGEELSNTLVKVSV